MPDEGLKKRWIQRKALIGKGNRIGLRCYNAHPSKKSNPVVLHFLVISIKRY